MQKGLFISLEGCDGSGKSTQRQTVADHYIAQGREVVLSREPGGTPYAERIREMIITPTDERIADMTELLMMFASRAQHVEEVIRPSLERGAVVICDRFVDSSYVYQHYCRGLPVKYLAQLKEMTVGNTMPDLTLYLRVPVEVSVSRMRNRKEDRFDQESSDFMTKVMRGFDMLAAMEPERFVIIDAVPPLEEVKEVIRQHLTEFDQRMASFS